MAWHASHQHESTTHLISIKNTDKRNKGFLFAILLCSKITWRHKNSWPTPSNFLCLTRRLRLNHETHHPFSGGSHRAYRGLRGPKPGICQFYRSWKEGFGQRHIFHMAFRLSPARRVHSPWRNKRHGARYHQTTLNTSSGIRNAHVETCAAHDTHHKDTGKDPNSSIKETPLDQRHKTRTILIFRVFKLLSGFGKFSKTIIFRYIPF